MSGRDFKIFLGSHKAQIGQQDNRLVSRFLAGHKPTYKPVDYDQLALLTQIKRSGGERSRRKLEKLVHVNKESKEHSVLQEHKRIWIAEYERLHILTDKLSKELIELRPPTPNYSQTTKPTEELYEEINDYEDFLYYDMQQFVSSTVQPVKDLNEDVKQWIKEHGNKLHNDVHNLNEEEQIRNVINSVRQQQIKVIAQLDKEACATENEVDLFLDQGFTEMKLPHIESELSSYMLNLQCPDVELRSSCFTEYHDLNEKYHQMLISLEGKYEHARTKVPWNWSEEDHLQFVHVSNQYANVSRNRRKLFLDRLKRTMPQKSKSEIEDYEKWWFANTSFQSQLKAIFHAWKRDQEDLKLQIKMLFNEASEEWEKRQQNMVDHLKQKFICNFLHEKLMVYQTERLELMKLEASSRAQQEKVEEEKRYQKELKEQKKREKAKQQVTNYKDKKLRLSAVKRNEDNARILALQEKHSLQRVHNMERVRFREEKLLEKVQQQELEQYLREQEEIEKEKRLQKLRDQVQVHVEDDPSRILEPTETMKHRIAAICYDEEKELQQPLFDVYTFTVDQVGQDKRLKIENALRRANLHMTDYARQLISNQPPPTQPRKDAQSTAFRSDFAAM